MTDQREHVAYVNDLARGFMRSEVLFAANEAGLFSHTEEPCTAADVAAKVGWDPRAARMLLEGLVALGLMTKSGDHFKNAPAASACLVPNRAGYQGHIVAHIRHTVARWNTLGESLRTGASAFAETGPRSPEETRSFILGMKDIAKTSAQEILKAVDLAPYRHLLDVGGGPATYAIAFLQTHPGMKATVFDRPEVIPIAREEAVFSEVDHRMKFMAGDMTADSIGSGYDLVLVSNIVHSFGPEKNRRLMKKCFDAMQPGGLLIVKDFLSDNDRTGPAFSLMFALHMLVCSGEGDTYSFADAAEWTREAGFEDGRIIDLTPQSRLWLVHKPFPAYHSSLLGILDKKTPASAPPAEMPTE